MVSFSHLLTRPQNNLSITDNLYDSLPFICTCRLGGQVFWSESFEVETETLLIDKRVVFI